MSASERSTTSIDTLAERLRAGAVIAYPTEAVWGLGCDPNNRIAVERLLALKQRDPKKGLILIAGDLSQVEPFLFDLSSQQRQTLSQSWPGPNTWLVPAETTAPTWIRGQHSSVAIRVSAHPVVQALCKAFGGPLVSTSANVQGMPAALTTTELDGYFGTQLDAIAPGELGEASAPSIIRDLISGAIVRPG